MGEWATMMKKKKTADRNENQSHENIDENDLSGQCLHPWVALNGIFYSENFEKVMMGI